LRHSVESNTAGECLQGSHCGQEIKLQDFSRTVNISFQGLNADIRIHHLMHCGCNNFRMSHERIEQKNFFLNVKLEYIVQIYNFVNHFQFP